MLSLAVTVLTGAAAFSPPPVPTGTLPAGAARSFPDATVATGGGTHGGTPLEQAVLLNEQEQKQEQLLSPEARASGLGGPSPTREFLEWFGEGEGALEEEGELVLGPIESYGEKEEEGESYAGDVKEKARATAVAEFLKQAEEEDGSYEARMDEFLEAMVIATNQVQLPQPEAEEGEGLS